VIGNEEQRSSFVLSPVHSGVIGELSFKTRLAIAEQTTLSFDNIRFEATASNGEPLSVAPECIAVISDSGTRFDYIYTCGDNIIRDRLNGTRLIKGITPNPATNELRLELNIANRMSVSVFDALGAEVLKSTSDRIDVSKLPNGVYYICVNADGVAESRRVVIER
jgi:hypothetical protein